MTQNIKYVNNFSLESLHCFKVAFPPSRYHFDLIKKCLSWFYVHPCEEANHQHDDCVAAEFLQYKKESAYPSVGIVQS